MKQPRKLLALLLVLLLTVGMFAGCGGKGEIADDPAVKPGGASDGSPDTPSVEGSTYDTGDFQALVPTGWKAFPQHDLFNDDPDAMDATALNICKGGTDDFDLYTKPNIYIKYNGPDGTLMEPDKDWYDDVADLAPLTTGSHNWTGFSGDSFGSRLIILFEDLGAVQLQVTIYYDTTGGKISLDDEDVQAILASIEITDPEGAAAIGSGTVPGNDDIETPTETEPESPYAWWDRDWYGWIVNVECTGDFEEAENDFLDCVAEIRVDDNDEGTVTITAFYNDWQAELADVEVYFAEGDGERGRMLSSGGTMYPDGVYYPTVSGSGAKINPMTLVYYDWVVEPEDEPYNRFENMICIKGYYTDPEDDINRLTYYAFLKPWGETWDDVRDGDTEGCLYTDMMPLYYDDWYLPLLELGYTSIVDYSEGLYYIENGTRADGSEGPSESGNSFTPTPLDPDGRFDGTGEVDMATLKRCLQCDWGYSTTYDEVAAEFGVHGRRELSEFYEDMVYYTWSCGDAYIKVAFRINADGTETWNNTMYDGIE